MQKGKLFLIPVPLAEDVERSSYVLNYTEIINTIDEYIVENEKTARRFLKSAGLSIPQSALIIHDYGKHARSSMDYNKVFLHINNGKNIGLMSEAGCPAIADPGSDVVEQAHRRGIQVVPMVGPSSILLALMGSGFNGQKFTFNGYLPIDKSERTKKLKELEIQSGRERMTQIFIETPFRNNQLLVEILRVCKGETRLCIAAGLTSKDEQLLTKSISEWRSYAIDLHKIPTIFLLFA